MKKISDYILHWVPTNTRIYSKCQIQLFELPKYRSDRKQYVFIITELSNNPGRSVTNGAEQIASMLLIQHSLLKIDVAFIEHYIRPEGEADTWDMLTFRKAQGQTIAGPIWASSTWKIVAQMIGAEGMEWKETSDPDSPWHIIETGDDLPKESGDYLVTLRQSHNNETNIRYLNVDMVHYCIQYFSRWAPIPK